MRRPHTDVEEKDTPCDRWSRSARRQPYKVIRVRLDIGRDREAGVQREVLELSLCPRRRFLLLDEIEPVATTVMPFGPPRRGVLTAVNEPTRRVLPFDNGASEQAFDARTRAGSGQRAVAEPVTAGECA
jgi:hypothetical protein